MENDSNRGRDLPRGPKFKPIEGLPTSEDIGDHIKLAKRRAIVRKALASATDAHGFDTLFESIAKVRPLQALAEKVKKKEHRLILEALSLGISVHPEMLKKYGLQLQPNPMAKPTDPNDIPF